MKHYLFTLIGLICSLPLFAQDFEYTYEGQSLTYTITDNAAKTCELKRAATNISGAVIIPSSARYEGADYTVTSIGNFAFQGCSSLTEVTIPTSVKSIGDHAFNGCIGLTSFAIPNSVEAIGDFAYFNSGFTTVNISSYVKSIGEGAFGACTNLKAINVDNSNAYYTDVNGVLYDKEITELLCCPGASTSLTIPNSVISIQRNAVQNCIGLTELTIPNSVTTIGEYAFYECSNISQLTIGSSVNTIREGAFEQCDGLTELTLPNSVTELGNRSFDICANLKIVRLPNSLKVIGNSAFNDCKALEEVYYSATEPILPYWPVFEGSYDKATLYVPEEAVAKCRSAFPWSYFRRIEAYDFLGVEDVTADIEGESVCKVYNLNGVRVGSSTDGLAPGMYIVRQGNTANKIVVN